ncbi:helix-turn-helix transcriptional regulator [Yoonia sp. SDW83-1]|uniref:helix-turn-helix transcriptional regulator n=1 Tax=Yoonia sp. SDW83-1 TaxID=3366945 RepID=UPI00398C4C43
MQEIFQENLNKLMEHRRLGDQDVAVQARVSQRTVNDLRNGRSSPQRNTLKKLESVFKVRLTDRLLTPEELGARLGYADAKFGGYKYSDLAQVKGDYLLYRRSFDYPDGVVISHLRISGEDTDDCFRFLERQSNLSREGERHDYLFQGVVAIVPQASVLQMRSRTDDGANVIRKTMNFRLSDNGVLLGVVMGLQEKTYFGYFPVASPVVAFKSQGKRSEATFRQAIGSKQISDVEDQRVLPKLEEVSKMSLAVVNGALSSADQL